MSEDEHVRRDCVIGRTTQAGQFETTGEIHRTDLRGHFGVRKAGGTMTLQQGSSKKRAAAGWNASSRSQDGVMNERGSRSVDE